MWKDTDDDDDESDTESTELIVPVESNSGSETAEVNPPGQPIVSTTAVESFPVLPPPDLTLLILERISSGSRISGTVRPNHGHVHQWRADDFDLARKTNSSRAYMARLLDNLPDGVASLPINGGYHSGRLLAVSVVVPEATQKWALKIGLKADESREHSGRNKLKRVKRQKGRFTHFCTPEMANKRLL
ncbi:hypothetical protein Clacol_004257 [Clathrus columnatus]|uniref:Uncharacterized protein n=1 Tax=Clathrus columnatus TaxID=1419009 RepID=A0AAV5AAI6_9AGAM|nr:hypothetical protein Clacol_004257 [Clathrus columnatus]